MDIDQIDRTKLFFIVGRIRSGTTLINNVLNSHKEIFIPQESPFILYLYTKYYKVEKWNLELLESFYRDLWLEYRLTQFWKLNEVKDELKKIIIGFGEKATFQRLIKSVILFQASRFGKIPSVIGDKNPSYTLHLNTLKKIFPNAKFVSMIRDPRSNILSCKRVTFDSNNTAILSERWNECIRNIHEFSKKSRKEHLVIYYENLLQRPENELKKICNHLNVEYSSDLINFHKSDKNLESWKYFKLKKFDDTKVFEWRDKLSNKDLSLVEWICSSMMQASGYEKESSYRVSRVDKLKSYASISSGKMLNTAEKLIYFFPLSLKAWIINKYRKHTKTM